MKKHILLILTLLSMLISACSTPTPTAQPTLPPVPTEATSQVVSESGLPPAAISIDEGGPAMVTGEWAYTSAYVARHFTEPVVILLNMSRQIQGNYTEWVPRSGEIMGTLTQPLAPSPSAYEVTVPVQPLDASMDVDNDGEQDTGVQIYAAVIGSNIAGDSYLEQAEQGGFTSYLSDPQTGAMREGTFLVYAPDDQQVFPSSAGADGVFFTADDPAVGLPAGYTHVTLTQDGKVSFDRSREVKMDILEEAAASSPDFSDQGILESYNSLIDVLKERYSYTELRGLDWEQIRQEYLPQVEAADKAGDLTAYYTALNKLALSIHDAHVYLFATNSELFSDYKKEIDELFGGGLGAVVVELSDGRFVVTFLDPEGPGAKAGWEVGTEIVSVDGVPIGERVDMLPLSDSAGNPEVIRLKQTTLALAFPVGAETTIEYQLPGNSDLRSATLTAVQDAYLFVPGPEPASDSISYKLLDNDMYYIQWNAFDDELYKIAVWEKFLEQAIVAPGIIIDMRHNSGGAVALLNTIVSYLFTAEKPAHAHWFDSYVYDDKTGDLVKEFSTDYLLSSPKPELAYKGAVVVLVGEGSASAAEYLPQFLQRQGRAIVVGEHGTEGAGGFVETVTMPGGFYFFFTKGRTFFAGTDELNLEAKGVTLDVRVPITLENELAKQQGQDVVLEAGMKALGEEVARQTIERLPGTTWQLTLLQEAGTESPIKAVIEDPTAYTITFGEDGQMSIKADCNNANAEYTIGDAGTITITVGPTTLAACPEGSLSERFLTDLATVQSLKGDSEQILLTGVSANGGTVLMLFQRAK